MPHQPGFCLLQSPRGGPGAHLKPEEKPEAQPAEKPEPEDPQVSGELGLEVTGSTRISQGGQQEQQVAGETLPPPESNSGLPATSPAVLPYDVGGTQSPRLPAFCPSVTKAPSPPKPSSSEETLELQPEPTITFLFTLLSTAEPTESKDPEG